MAKWMDTSMLRDISLWTCSSFTSGSYACYASGVTVHFDISCYASRGVRQSNGCSDTQPFRDTSLESKTFRLWSHDQRTFSLKDFVSNASNMLYATTLHTLVRCWITPIFSVHRRVPYLCYDLGFDGQNLHNFSIVRISFCFFECLC